MSAAVEVIGQGWLWIRRVRIVALLPVEAECFLAIKKDEPIGDLSLLFACGHNPRKFQQFAGRGPAIVGSYKFESIHKLRVVVAGDNHHIARSPREFACDVAHLAISARRRPWNLIG